MNVTQKVKSWFNKAKTTGLVVIDVESGGLNDSTHLTDPKIPVGMTGAQFYPILEITARFFDGNMDEISEPQTFVINPNVSTIEELELKCSDWSIERFKESLFLECVSSTVTLADAEASIANTIKGIGKDNWYIVGNSVSLDKAFITHQMPTLSSLLAYRIFDVSTLKVWFSLMYGDDAKFEKAGTHRTEQDTDETIKELLFYWEHFVKSRELVARDLIS
ncbi:exonuclease domain-containing protein [Vibrio coralliirubri]|uniref:exonuclease domain-containing protein n=1 Tax=Vibrio coralliirubri TaxID=1516159 RepID=UPI0022844032|nr:exonuclease domain-containing protein [Vibrio coralliirubri]MCY9861179.1 exonuclease domain-containing protein [Vibrio coralliirubri]